MSCVSNLNLIFIILDEKIAHDLWTKLGNFGRSVRYSKRWTRLQSGIGHSLLAWKRDSETRRTDAGAMRRHTAAVRYTVFQTFGNLIARNSSAPNAKEFLKSCEGFLRATLTVHVHPRSVCKIAKIALFNPCKYFEILFRHTNSFEFIWKLP